MGCVTDLRENRVCHKILVDFYMFIFIIPFQLPVGSGIMTKRNRNFCDGWEGVPLCNRLREDHRVLVKYISNIRIKARGQETVNESIA